MATIPSSLLRSPLPILRSWELHRLTLKGGRFHRPNVQPLAAQGNRRGLMSPLIQPLAAPENRRGLMSPLIAAQENRRGLMSPLIQPLAAQENRRSLMSIGCFNHDLKYGRMLYLESPMAGLVRSAIIYPENNNKHESFPEFENGNLKWEGSTQLKSGSAYRHIHDGHGHTRAVKDDKVTVNLKHYDMTCKDHKSNSYKVKNDRKLEFCLGEDNYSEFQFVVYGMKEGDIRRIAINLNQPDKPADWEVYDVKLLEIQFED